MLIQHIQFTLPHLTYPIYIGTNLFDFIPSLINGHQVLIVTQKSVADYHLLALQEKLMHHQCDVVYLQEGDQYKTLSEWQKIIDTLMQQKHERSTTLLALGGGMIGDMTGFAAACYQRGVNYIQVPTTLMSQVDSAVGGKTGLNYGAVKNMLGAFYHPNAVIADVNLLKTLSEREYISGLAEVVKYGLIWDAEFFYELEKNKLSILRRDFEIVSILVAKCLVIKTQIVAQDEKDHGLRNLLNFGHTVGHALEVSEKILHGEAVAIGMLVAAKISAERKFISEQDVERITQLLTSFGLFQYISTLPPVSSILPWLQHDKKIVNQQLQFILLKKIGQAVKVNVAIEEIAAAISR